MSLRLRLRSAMTPVMTGYCIIPVTIAYIAGLIILFPSEVMGELITQQASSTSVNNALTGSFWVCTPRPSSSWMTLPYPHGTVPEKTAVSNIIATSTEIFSCNPTTTVTNTITANSVSTVTSTVTNYIISIDLNWISNVVTNATNAANDQIWSSNATLLLLELGGLGLIASCIEWFKPSNRRQPNTVYDFFWDIFIAATGVILAVFANFLTAIIAIACFIPFG